MSWTEERVTLLTKLWGDGVSASLIADQLGDATRNAVIGKVHRLGLEGRKTEIWIKPKPPIRSNLEPSTSRDEPVCSFGGDPEADSLAPDNERYEMRAYNGRRPPRSSKKRDLIVISKPDSSFRCTIVDLTESTCRWPIGNPGMPDFRYCGAPGGDNLSGRPYCPYHAEMAAPKREAA